MKCGILLRRGVPALALVLAGCASPTQKIAFGEPGSVDSAIKQYYQAHATENLGRCTNPFIDGVTQANVVEQSTDRLVVDVHYVFRDLADREASMSNLGNLCRGFGERQFTLVKSKGGLEVVEMSGPQRGRGPSPSA